MTTERPYHALRAIPDIEQRILEGIAAGKSLKAIADEFGVCDVAILRRIEDNPNYKPYRRIGLRLRMDQREQELESAPDNVSVTRADRLLGHARWLAERLDSETYGQKNETKIDASVTVRVLRIGETVEGEKPLLISEALDAGGSVIPHESTATD